MDPFLSGTAQKDPTNWNRYSYAGNDPINNTDSKGLAFCPAQFNGEVCAYLDGLPFDDPGAQCVYQAMFVGVAGVPGLQTTYPCQSIPTLLLLAAAAPEQPKPRECEIEVRYASIDLPILKWFDVNHTMAYMKDTNGAVTVIDGFPLLGVVPSMMNGEVVPALVMGTTESRNGYYANADIARVHWISDQSTKNCSTWATIQNFAARLDHQVFYSLITSNSNSLTSYLINDIGGFNVTSPPKSPGWGDGLIRLP